MKMHLYFQFKTRQVTESHKTVGKTLLVSYSQKWHPENGPTQ